MISIDGNFEGSDQGNYTTSYITPEPNKKFEQIKYLQWKGFFTISKIKQLIEELISLTKRNQKNAVVDARLGEETEKRHKKRQERHSKNGLLQTDNLVMDDCYKGTSVHNPKRDLARVKDIFWSEAHGMSAPILPALGLKLNPIRVPKACWAEGQRTSPPPCCVKIQTPACASSYLAPCSPGYIEEEVALTERRREGH
ncbi:hypothetical protein NQ314_009796 [Rhamnusium bicolor]|uniref:Uncharacterized protein n=1 Tax=Rhamnusium bicolor TaxID=1586634 RepID=A0AAV8XVS9_9CUCU|nr:hypothetical protein NQ314_009796 [Rhamnusium bicolor]